MIIDDIIGFFSPTAKFKRLRARMASDIISKRMYDGASRAKRTKNWRTPSSSANAEIRGQLRILRDRSRDLVRNDPYAARGVSIISANTIGKGIIPHIKNQDKSSQDQISAFWREWADKNNCDFDGTKTYSSIQMASVRSMVESGEVLIRRRFVKPESATDIPLKLQILESDFIDSSMNRSLENGNTVIQGIEFDENGKRVAYYLYEDHPGNSGMVAPFKAKRFNSNRVPAEEIAHIYREDRPNQIRGVPWLAPVMLRLKDFADFEDAQLMRQKIASCFSVFVIDTEFDGEMTEQEQDELSKVEPGIIEYLAPGKDVRFANPPGVENYKEYSSTQLHAIAAGLGISYEALTGDLSEVNFSSARMGWLEFQRNIDVWRSQIINPQLNQKVFDWFLQAVSLLGINAENTFANWTSPRREMIDPTKEIPAKIKAIRSGIQPLSEVVRESGSHIDDVLQEIYETNILIDKYNLVLDSDPRKVDHAGDIHIEEPQ